MRIHFFSTSLRFTGGRQVMVAHAAELARRGHEVVLYTESANNQPEWARDRLPVRRFTSLAGLPPADFSIFDRCRLAAPLLREKNGHVVHLCQGYEGSDAETRFRQTWAKRGVFGAFKLWKLYRRRKQIERAYGLPTIKVVIHHPLAELIARRFGQTAYVVSNGLPDGVFRADEPADEQPENAVPTVLVVGPTDVGWKRVADALSAVKRLKEQRPVRLVRIAQHEMRDGERAAGVTDEYHTMLTPARMAEQYRRADVLLLPSDATEGFGLPFLEALASGLPCLVTDIPAFRTYAAPDDYAHFVPVGDVAGMTAALGRLLDAPAERQRLRERGLQVASGYTQARSFDRMEQLLLALANRTATAEFESPLVGRVGSVGRAA